MPKDTKGKAAVRGGQATDSPKRSNTKPYHKSTAPSSSNGSSSSSSKPNKKPRFEKPQSSSSIPSQPGASKIKASIRQTKRLLAKPNLAPGTKIEAERRLKSLEADLEVASHKQVEKSRATRYHRIKFVERQKLVRRIARCKRNLARLATGKAADTDSEGDASEDDEGYKSQSVKESKMSKGELEKLLKSLRELLQYVVQYPADLRYVALFSNAEEGGPSPPDANEKDKSRQNAFQHLERVKNAMKGGEISSEPEVELNSKDRSLKKLAHSDASKAGSVNVKQKADKKSDKAGKRKHDHEQVDHDERAEDARGVKGDDFFAQDSD